MRTTMLRTAALACVAAATGGCAAGMAAAPGMMGSADLAAHAFASATDMGEVQAGQLALARAQDPAVRTYAAMMVSTHSNALATREARMEQLGMGLADGMRMQGMAWTAGDGEAMRWTGDGMAMPAAGQAAGQQAGSGMAMNPSGGAMTTSAGTHARFAMAVDPARLPDMGELHAMLMAHPASRPMVEMNMQSMQRLQAVTGAAFDREYVTTQIAGHRMALQTMDAMIADRSRPVSPEVLGVMQSMRASVAGHLEAAMALQGGMAR